MPTIDDVKATLRTALREAMRARDSELTSLWREVLAAFENAEAPALPSSSSSSSSLASSSALSSPIAGAISGAGAGEIARLVLSADDVAAIVSQEVQERQAASTSYAALGRSSEAAMLGRQVKALEALFRL